MQNWLRSVPWWVRECMVVVVVLAVGSGLAALAHAGPRGATFAADAFPALVPMSGVNEVEVYTDRPGVFRWTGAVAQIRLPNPGGPLALTLDLEAGPRQQVPVTVTIDDLAFTIDVTAAQRMYAIELPAQADDRITVTLASPPERTNNRDLGVVFAGARVIGAGLPGHVLLALAAAALGVYPLLRRAGAGPFVAGAVVVTLQALVAGWHAGAGWEYALLDRAMLAAGGAGLFATVVSRWLPAGEPARPMPGIRADLRWIAGVVVLALLVRLPWLVVPDPVGDLELSARRMGELYRAGFAGAYTFEGDYMPLRLYWLRGFAHIVGDRGVGFQAPLHPLILTLIKLPGLLADLATVALVGIWARRWHSVRGAAGFAALYALAPPVWMNVAWWGQVDAILMFPLLLALVLLDRAGGRISWVCWAIALLIKPQAILFAPVLFAATLRQHGARGIAEGVGLAVGAFVAGCVPLALLGQGPGMLQAYTGSVGRFPSLTSNAYNLWYLVTGGASGPDTDLLFGVVSLRLVGLALVGSAALTVVALLLRRAGPQQRAAGGAVLALAFFVLPTQIHERYLFLALAPLVLAAAADQRFLPLTLAVLLSATVNIVGTLAGFVPALTPIIAGSPLPLLFSASNCVVLVLALLAFWRGTIAPRQGRADEA